MITLQTQELNEVGRLFLGIDAGDTGLSDKICFKKVGTKLFIVGQGQYCTLIYEDKVPADSAEDFEIIYPARTLFSLFASLSDPIAFDPSKSTFSHRGNSYRMAQIPVNFIDVQALLKSAKAYQTKVILPNVELLKTARKFAVSQDNINLHHIYVQDNHYVSTDYVWAARLKGSFPVNIPSGQLFPIHKSLIPLFNSVSADNMIEVMVLKEEPTTPWYFQTNKLRVFVAGSAAKIYNFFDAFFTERFSYPDLLSVKVADLISGLSRMKLFTDKIPNNRMVVTVTEKELVFEAEGDSYAIEKIPFLSKNPVTETKFGVSCHRMFQCVQSCKDLTDEDEILIGFNLTNITNMQISDLQQNLKFSITLFAQDSDSEGDETD